MTAATACSITSPLSPVRQTSIKTLKSRAWINPQLTPLHARRHKHKSQITHNCKPETQPTMANVNWRTINIDAYDVESAFNFPISTLLPSSLPAPSTAAESAQIAQQVRQLLRAGDSLGALQSALETAPLAGDEQAKQVHLTTVLEVLQGIRQSDATRVLQELLGAPGGTALGDTLMKYLYKGMATTSGGGKNAMSPQTTGSVDGAGRGGFSQVQSRNFGEGGGGAVMSVLLGWHEKLTELVGVGGIVRVMSDRRTV